MNCNLFHCNCNSQIYVSNTNTFTKSSNRSILNVDAEHVQNFDKHSVSFENSILNDCIERNSDSEIQQLPEHLNSISDNNVDFNEISSFANSNNLDTFSIDLNSKGINIGHLNVQGICGDKMSKFSEISAILTAPENSKLHIFGMSETKLKSHKINSIFKVNGFQSPFRKDNNDNGGGGIIVYVREGILAKRREDLETNDIACLWLEICPNNGKSFLVGNMYRPPDTKVEFNDRFEDFIDIVSDQNKEFIILGDFNRNLLNCEIERDWGNFTSSLGLTQLISEPTRVTQESQTLIDHIYTNNEETIQSVSVEKMCISDHFAVFCNRKSHASFSKNTHQVITYRSFKNFEEAYFLSDLSSVPWEILEQFDNVDDIVNVWNTLFLEILDKHAPIKSHRVKKKYQSEWLSSEILDCMKQRNKYKLNGNISEYKQMRNKVTDLTDIAKKKTYQTKIEEGKSDPRTIWKLFKEFGLKGKGNDNENNFAIKCEDNIITAESDLAILFNNYFVNVASKLQEPIINSEFEYLNTFVESKVPNDVEFKIPLTNAAFVNTFLSNLNISKSTGLDNIGPKILKLSANIIAPSLVYIINKSITSGTFPSVWKEAKVKPLFKSGDKDDINNYRPISILPTVSKLIEKWVDVNFSLFLNNFSLLHKSQSGFRAKHSTESAMILMVDSWLKALNSGKLVGCVMVDFRKAFDLVDHQILLKKLQSYKCSDSCLSWFNSYLINRTQRVVLNNELSDSSVVNCGVPQGSILGPLLFLLFINDLPLLLHDTVSFVDLYADDTTLYEQHSDLKTLQRNLQKSLNLLHDWCRKNGMVLNTLKTKVMLITSRQKRNNLHQSTLTLTYSDMDIRMTTSDKILGVYVDENLCWNDHYQHISKKVSSYLWLLSKIKSYLSLDHKLLYYNSYIKPQFDYCSIIWSNSSDFNVNKINKLQRRACKLILSSDYKSLNESLEQLDILSFDQSVFLSKAKIMYKVYNNLAPGYLIELFQMREGRLDSTLSNLRSVANKNYVLPQAKCNLFKGSLSFSGVVVWNSIPLEIKQSSSLNIFSKRCSEWIKS